LPSGFLEGSVSDIVRNRLKWRSWLAARPYANLTVRTGGGVVATGAGGAVVAGAVPVAWAIYNFVNLGLPYLEARRIVAEENTQSGFSQGWVAGLLRWEWRHVLTLFGRRRVLRTNEFDPQTDVIRAEAYNKGLIVGYLTGYGATDDLAKTFLHTLRGLAGGVQAGRWYRTDQISYVIDLAGAARKHGIVNFGG
jgi:hypothetical protein